MMKKRIIALGLSVAMILGNVLGNVSPVQATEMVNSTDQSEIIASGNLETGSVNAIKWELNSKDTLTISGTGEIPHYIEYYREAPWKSYRDTIKKVVIGPGITRIGHETFFKLTNMVELELGEDVKIIGERSFLNCKSLETLILPDKVTTIEAEAFSGCNSLKSVKFSEKLQKIQSKAFSNCYGLTSINIPKGKIEEDAFVLCGNLKQLVLGAGVTYIDERAFSSCEKIEEIVVDGSNNYFSTEENVLFDKEKEYLIKYPALKQDISYVIPDTVETIASQAFRSNVYLETVEISDSVTQIGKWAFYGCGNLKNIKLSSNLTEIPSYFAYNAPIKEIVIPSKVKSIGEYAFNKATLSVLTIPRSVTTIGISAFNISSTKTIYFNGNNPLVSGSFTGASNNEIERHIYYPAGDDTWTEAINNMISGNNVWVAFTPELLAIDCCEIQISEEDSITYDGREQKPDVVVKDGTIILEEGTHYTIKYVDNIYPGEASIIITGCGDYEGTVTRWFTIKKAKLDVTVSSYSGIYDRASHSFNRKITSLVTTEYQAYYSTSVPLNKANYATLGSVTKPSRTNPGTTTVYYYIVDKDGYCEAVTGNTYIAIRPKCTASDYAGMYDGESHTPEITCSEGATLYYSTINELNFSNYISEGTTILPERIYGGVTNVYYIAVPDENPAENSVTTGSAQIVIEGESEPQKIYITDCSIDVETNLTYTGTALEPKVSVLYQGKTLVKDKDYTLQYKNNTAVGTGSVVITGIGEYTGSVTKSFVIKEEEKPITKLISDCQITLSQTAFTYNGKSQIPEVVVEDENQGLVQNEDYTVSSDVAIDAGTYSITVKGLGDYSGSTIVSYKILQAEPLLKFESQEVTKNTEDVSFTNNLDVITDGSLTYSSDNTSVATVNAYTGLVKIVGAGTATIHVKASAGHNYLSGEATYVLKVTEKEEEPVFDLALENLSYSFGNVASSFDYPSKYTYPLSIYQIIFGKTTKAAFWYDRDYDINGGAWKGNCAGFSGTSALMADPDSGISIKDFDSSANTIGQLNAKSKSALHGINITQFIEAMQIAQHTQLFTNEITNNRIYTGKHINKKVKNLNGFYETLKKETDAERPVIIALYQSGGHAVLAYDVKDVSATKSQVYIYDSNWPSEERILTLEKDSEGNFMKWSYEIGGSYGVWGTNSSSSSISYVPYSVVKEIWDTKGNLDENSNVLSINSGSVAIYTSGDKPVATVTQGELSTTNDEIQIVEYLSLERAETDTVLLSVPVDVYTFQNLDKSVDEFEVAMTNTNLGAKAATTADTITMAVDDSCNLNAVYIEAGGDDTYSITLNSSFSYDEDNVVVTGKGNGDTMEVSQTKGNISINNCQITSIKINGEEINKYQISASAGEGGKITPDGETVVTKGESVTYKITPLNGYVISNVSVDGESVGAVSAYTFGNVEENHEIKATFKKQYKITASSGTGGKISPSGGKVVVKGNSVTYKITPSSGYRISSVYVDGKNVGAVTTYKFSNVSDDHTIKANFKKKSTNTITAKNFVKIYSTKAQSFYIKPTVKGRAKLSYSSNNKNVKVTSGGKVTIAKKFVGKASITIKSAATNTYLGAKKVITVTVKPKGTSLSSLKRAGSGKMTVSWKKNTAVSGYQISYSTSSSFKSAKTVTIKKYGTTKTTIKNLKKNKAYYVRVRTYKTVNGTKYYSGWSGKKSLKVK